MGSLVAPKAVEQHVLNTCTVIFNRKYNFNFNMAKTDKYYKEFSLSGIPKSDLKNEEHANIYRTPAKDKVRPNLQGWKEDAVHQADLLQNAGGSERL